MAQTSTYVAPFGAEYVLAGTFPPNGSNGRQQLVHILLNRWLAEWMHRYLSRGYVFRDPAVARAQSSVTPFFWSELEPFIGDDPRRVMDEAGEFNLKKGFSGSLVTLDVQPVGFSLAGRNLEIHAETSGMLSLIASYAIARAIALKQENSSDKPVTRHSLVTDRKMLGARKLRHLPDFHLEDVHDSRCNPRK